MLGYTDDFALSTRQQKNISALTRIANKSMEMADMKVYMTKTFSQHVHKRGEITVIDAEMNAAQKKHAHKCNFCESRFKTQRDMYIHWANCIHNCNTTDTAYGVADVLGVFGFIEAR